MFIFGYLNQDWHGKTYQASLKCRRPTCELAVPTTKPLMLGMGMGMGMGACSDYRKQGRMFSSCTQNPAKGTSTSPKSVLKLQAWEW